MPACAARALAAMDLGRIDDETTANAGLIAGGSAVNVVAERCMVRAEARSRDEQKLAAQVAGMVEAITVAAAETGVGDAHGKRVRGVCITAIVLLYFDHHV